MSEKQREEIRVSVALETDQDPEDFLLRLEEELGRPLKPVRRLRLAKVLSFWMTAPELARVRAMPGVRLAERENRYDAPRPVQPRGERE